MPAPRGESCSVPFRAARLKRRLMQAKRISAMPGLEDMVRKKSSCICLECRFPLAPFTQGFPCLWHKEPGSGGSRYSEIHPHALSTAFALFALHKARCGRKGIFPLRPHRLFKTVWTYSLALSSWSRSTSTEADSCMPSKMFW